MEPSTSMMSSPTLVAITGRDTMDAGSALTFLWPGAEQENGGPIHHKNTR